jgi:hypothetical protein
VDHERRISMSGEKFALSWDRISLLELEED